MIENEPDPLRRISTKHSTEVRAEVGKLLSAARVKRGLTVEAVARQTRIPKRYLDALEADRFDEFPAYVYMRSFLKNYCDHLDIPFEELWDKIQPPEPAAAPEDRAPAAPAAAKPLKKESVPHPAPAPHDAPPRGGSSATGAIAFAVLLAAALGVLLLKDRRAPDSDRAAETTPRVLMPLPRASEPKVGLLAVNDAWIRVTVDDQVAFEGRLPRGGTMEWKPSRSLSLRTTAPAALQLTVNGAPRPLAHPKPDGEYSVEVQ